MTNDFVCTKKIGTCFVALGVGFSIAMAALMQGSQDDFIATLVDAIPHVQITDERREAAIHELVRWSAQNVPMFPLVHLNNVWAHRPTVTHAPRMDERTLAMGVRPAR